MSIQLRNTGWKITDEVGWTKDWVGISHGDVYQGDHPFGYYVAAWYPNTDRPMVMIITAVDRSPPRDTLSIGVRCPRGNLDALAAVDPDETPWDGGVSDAPMARLDEFEVYPRAQEALDLAKDIVRLDRSLRKYVCDPEIPIAADDDDDGWAEDYEDD
jgi:hypothetical protein